MKNYFLILFVLILFNKVIYSESLLKNKNQKFSDKYLFIRDTLYTFSNFIIEVYIPEQKIYLHSRDGNVLEFLCSTGNPKLEKGVSTPEGIFVIQNKARKVYSAQFDSTLMINWMGFNFNIGFHALQGKSYYKYLGRRVSSHGCIRVSFEASQYFFENIPIGTPVFIHSGKSARVVTFTNKNDHYRNVNKKQLLKLSKENLKSIYSGLYQKNHHKLVIAEKNLGHSGLELGDEDKIPPQLPSEQIHLPYHLDRRLFSIK